MSQPIGTGFTYELSYADYAKLPGINISTLKEMGRSPLHYQHKLTHHVETAAMRLGHAAHTAVLEPSKFAKTYALWDAKDAKGKLRVRAGKEWEKFCELTAGRTVLTENEYVRAMDMSAAVRANKIAMRYLATGAPEVSMVWVDSVCKVACRGRMDWVTSVDNTTIVGLKTSRNAGPVMFGNQAARLGYDPQWSYYLDGYETLTRRTPRMVEIVVESDPPHDVVVYSIPQDILERGRDQYQKLLRKHIECTASGIWPGVATAEVELTYPTWAYQEEDDDVSDIGLEMSDE